LGIYLEDSEIKLFKQIYENYIIDTIDNLFKDTLKIPENSSYYPQLYIQLRIILMLEEAFWEKYKIVRLKQIRTRLSKYIEIISNLNRWTNKVYLEPNQQQLDQESYRNELNIRKESEPNWLLFKDGVMQKKMNNQGIEVLSDMDSTEDSLEYFKQNEKKYIKQINDFLLNQSINDFKQNHQLFKKNQEWSEIFHWQNLVLGIIKSHGGAIWFDTRIKKYGFRSKIGSKIVYESKDSIGDLLTRALKDKITYFLNQTKNGYIFDYAIEIVLVKKLNDAHKQKLKIEDRASNVLKILVFENEFISIDDDTFDCQSPYEFSQKNGEFYWTRNRFIPTEYLKKRFDTRPLLDDTKTINFAEHFKYNEDTYLFEKNQQQTELSINPPELSFIEKFLFYLVDEDYHLYYYVMNWLAVFFNNLEKSGTTLVLLGDQEVTQNIFWDKIIKEIFGIQHCVTLNDEECSTASSFDIAMDKLFFHIGDITDPATKFDDETLFNLVKDLLVKSSISKRNEDNEKEDTVVHGQMIITTNNPYPYIKRAMSKCSIIKVNDMDTIIDKLGIPDQVKLEDKIQKDLDNFTDTLLASQKDIGLAQSAIDTQDRESITNIKSPNIDKKDLDDKLDAFIQAIKNKDIDYFEKVKDNDGVIYEHLKNAFNKDEGYFIGQDLHLYYNSIHAQKYENKKHLMDKLKDKDEMFNQEVKTLKILDKEQNEQVLFQAYTTSKETKNKELYKIADYKMPKDIIIPSGATIISSQQNLTKYGYENREDIKNCKKRTEEYRAKKNRE